MLLKSFRYLLFPLSFIYGAIIWMRNRLYDANILKSASFNFPLICIGNLATGGTGKTPMTEYIIRLLKEEFVIATLSRGYKRKTKGFGIANENTTALEIGDEPMQFHKKFPGITVAVGEERLVAIPQLLQDKPSTEVIILDDAFQHRAVKAGLNILLTEYSNPYTRDLLMPAGDLRDLKSSAKRAEIIIVTKCRSNLSVEKKHALIKELHPAKNQDVFFTRLEYGTPYHLFTRLETTINPDMDGLLVTGIANPAALKDYLTAKVHAYDMLRYPDHHIFDSDDLKEIKKHFEKIKASNKIILTTEKDGVRMKKFETELLNYPIYVLPVQHKFLFDEEEKFNSCIVDFIRSFKASIDL